MAREANSKHAPQGILHHANEILEQSNPDSFYSGSYLSSYGPSTDPF